MVTRSRHSADGYKLQALLVTATAFILLKLLAPSQDALATTIVNEVLTLGLAYFIVLNVMNVLGKTTQSPTTLVKSVFVALLGVVALAHASEAFLSSVFGRVEDLQSADTIWMRLFSFFYNVALLGTAAYVLIVFRELFFLKQKRDLRAYYNAMLAFIALGSVTAFLDRYEEWSFIHVSFVVVAHLLVLVNSARISWIAFLTKKQKTELILVSVLAGAAAIYAVAFLAGDDVHDALVATFSRSAHQFVLLILGYAIIYFVILFWATLFHLPTAEAFDRKTREISSLQYLSRLINRSSDPEELSATIADIATQVTGADAAWLVILDNGEEKIVAPRAVGFLDAEKIYRHCRATLQDPISSCEALSLANLRKTERLDRDFSHAALTPLRFDNRVKGHLLVANEKELPFDDEDKNAVLAFGDYASVALENSRLIKSSIEKERMERELEVARELQRKLLPQRTPSHNGLEVASAFIPAFETGGDYYDFFMLGDGRLGFVVADVSGKGISAAFIMAELKGVFESIVSTERAVREILGRANKTLERTIDRGVFITASFGALDVSTGDLTLARAGHTPTLLSRNEEVREITPKGIGLGLNFTSLFDDALAEESLRLQAGDVLAIFTDGVTEAMNGEQKEFSLDSLKRIVREARNESAEEIARRVVRAVADHSAGARQHDDVTLLILKWNANTEQSNG